MKKRKKEKKENIHLQDWIGCFRNFSIDDPICKRYCVLSLRCMIEKEQYMEMEIIDELLYAGGNMLRIQ